MKTYKLFIAFLYILSLSFTSCDSKNPFDNSPNEIGITGDEIGNNDNDNGNNGNGEEPEKVYKIMPIGDSLTEAANPGYRGFLYKKLIENGFKVDFVGVRRQEPENGGDPDHAGFGGHIIGPDENKHIPNGNIYYHLDNGENILSVDCDIILLMIGINDFFNLGDNVGYHPENDGAIRLEGLIEKIYTLRPEVTILVSNLTPVGWDMSGFAWRFNQQVPEIVEQQQQKGHNCHFVDVRNLASWNRETDFPPDDELHFNASGYEKLANVFYDSLSSILTD